MSSRGPRRESVSFLGGPFLVNMLHQLPPSLVQLVFSYPDSHPERNHTRLVQLGLDALLSHVNETLAVKLPSWKAEQVKLVRKQALRHSALRQLALDWALDERARDLTPAYDPETDKPEQLILALAGAIRQHIGQQEVKEWLTVVMEPTIDEAAEKIALALHDPTVTTPNLDRSPDLAGQPFFQPLLHPAVHPHPAPPFAPIPPTASEPPTTYGLVTQALASLPLEIRAIAFTHPSINPTANMSGYAPSGLAFLRSTVQKILFVHAPQLSPDQVQAITDASVSADTIRPLALGWALDKEARHRGTPDSFLKQHAEALFFSLIGGTRLAFGEEPSGEWLMQVMGEYVRETFESVAAAAEQKASESCPPSCRPGDEALTTMLNEMPASAFEGVLADGPAFAKTAAPHFRRATSRLAKIVFQGLPERRSQSFVDGAVSDEMLHARAAEFGLHLHPRLVGRVDTTALGPVLLAVAQARFLQRGSTQDSRDFVDLVMRPILSRMKERADALGSDREDGSTPDSTPARPAKPSVPIKDAAPPPPPLPPIFSPPSAGPQALKMFLSWLTPPTIEAAVTHRSAGPINYDSLLFGSTTQEKLHTSFLFITLTEYVETWFQAILAHHQRVELMARALGAPHLARLAREIGLTDKITTQPPGVARDEKVRRDVLVALVQGALKDVPRDTVAKWIGTTFRAYIDQLKLLLPKASQKKDTESAGGGKNGKGGGSGGGGKTKSYKHKARDEARARARGGPG